MTPLACMLATISREGATSHAADPDAGSHTGALQEAAACAAAQELHIIAAAGNCSQISHLRLVLPVGVIIAIELVILVKDVLQHREVKAAQLYCAIRCRSIHRWSPTPCLAARRLQSRCLCRVRTLTPSLSSSWREGTRCVSLRCEAANAASHMICRPVADSDAAGCKQRRYLPCPWCLRCRRCRRRCPAERSVSVYISIVPHVSCYQHGDLSERRGMCATCTFTSLMPSLSSS